MISKKTISEMGTVIVSARTFSVYAAILLDLYIIFSSMSNIQTLILLTQIV